MNASSHQTANVLYRRWRPLLAAATALSALLFAHNQLRALADGRAFDAWRSLVDAVIAGYGAGLLIFPALALARKFRFSKGKRTRDLSMHAAGALLFALAHSALLAAAALWLEPAASAATWMERMVDRFLPTLPIQIFVYALAVGLMLAFERYRQGRDAEIKAAELTARLTEAQLDALQRQIQPQFLANTLNAISGLVFSNPVAAEEMIVRLSALLRHAFRPQHQAEATLAAEMRLLDLYLDIMRLRFAERLFVRVDIPNELHDAEVPRLLLQPLVEHALKHGGDPLLSLVSVTVGARAENGVLTLKVTDCDGKVQETKTASVLVNLAERIERLYGSGYGISVVPLPESGVEIAVRVPFHRRAGS